MSAPAVEIHEVQFHTNRATGMGRALCTCGWVKFGPLDECRSAAATHDMDWQPVSHEVQGTGYDPGASGHELQGRKSHA